jgi:chromosome segregation ATPase
MSNQTAQMTQIASAVSSTLAQIVANEQQTGANTKRLIDRLDPLDSVVGQNTQAMLQLAKLVETFGQTMSGTLGEMRGAQTAIVNQVNTHADANVTDLQSTMKALEQKAVEHHAMTEQTFKELIAQLEGVPAAVADLLRPMIQEMQAQAEQIKRLDAALAAKTTALATAEARISQLDATLPAVPMPPAGDPPKPAEAEAEHGRA